MLDALEHLIEASPDSLQREVMGRFPIHTAVSFWRNPEFAKAILRRDPACASKINGDQSLPLHMAATTLPDPNLHVLQLLFDAHPEGIWDTDPRGHTPPQLARSTGRMINAAFLDRILMFASLTRNPTFMVTPDKNNQLPLHRALRGRASLGVIKLLAKANPAAFEHCDAFGDYPLHHACRRRINAGHTYYTSSLETIKLLVNGNPAALQHRGFFGDYPLHHACRARNCAVVKFLLGSQGAMASELNNERKLPIELLCQSETNNQRTKVLEITWLLLRAYPEIFLHCASEQRTNKKGNCCLYTQGLVRKRRRGHPGHYLVQV